MKKLFSMAALAMVGATFTGCSNEDDSIIDTTQQPEVIKSNVVTMTTTVGLDGAAATRALTSTGVKTFAKDDKIAVVYEKNDGTMAKVESTALTKDDISADGKSATFTVTLSDAKASGTVKYIYPAAMAGATDVNYTKLNSQDGTLDNLGKNLDLAVFNGNLTAEAKLPASASLENQLAILAVTLKDEAGTSDITSSTTKLTVSDGTNTYNVMRSAVAGPIYVAIRPTTSATIDITATSGGKGYYKTLTGKTYAKGNGYSVSWRMHEPTLADVFTEGAEVNVKVNTANGYWFNAAGTYSSGSYTGVTQTNQFGDEGFNKGISMTKDGNNLVVWMKNSYNEITITFNTTNNTYTVTAGESAGVYRMTTFNSITINGVDITSLLSEPPMETITFSSGSGTWDPDADETLYTGTHFKVTVSGESSGVITVNKWTNMEISATDGKTITKVVFNYNWKNNLDYLTFSSGTFDGNATVNNVNASTLTVTSSHAAGTKYNGVTIYYE